MLQPLQVAHLLFGPDFDHFPRVALGVRVRDRARVRVRVRVKARVRVRSGFGFGFGFGVVVRVTEFGVCVSGSGWGLW